MLNTLPPLVGIGLKPEHFQTVLDHPSLSDQDEPDHIAPAGWLEVHPQNYFGDGGPPHKWLAAISESYPISFHSVGLSLGSADGLNQHDLEKIASLCERYDAASVSDHLSFSGNAHDRFADLLPVIYTQESLDHFCKQIDIVQTRLKRPMLIENPSRYLEYRGNEMSEIEFIERMVSKTGCGIIFDVNNVEVSCKNLGEDCETYIDAINPDWVGEMHLAGHAIEDHDSGPLRIDNHGSPVTDFTWELFERFISKSGPKPVLIEWDTDIPSYDILMAEVQKARDVIDIARNSAMISASNQSSERTLSKARVHHNAA